MFMAFLQNHISQLFSLQTSSVRCLFPNRYLTNVPWAIKAWDLYTDSARIVCRGPDHFRKTLKISGVIYHRRPRRNMCDWMNILIFTWTNKCDESSKLPWTKIVQKSKYNKTKLRYLQLNVSLSFLAGLSGILLSFAIKNCRYYPLKKN